jgi:tetratricopeptide (TPR) repeat protein
VRDKEGEKQWYECLVATPGTAPEVAGKAYCNLRVLAERTTDQEIVCYEKSLKILPSNSFPASYSLGCAYAVRKDWDLAIAAFPMAIEAAENSSEREGQVLHKISIE